MSKNIIEIKGLVKTFKVPERDKSGMLASVKSLFNRKFKYVTAVKEIDLDIEEGEIRGLIGPNGAGKSTIIKMLSGILYPTKGSVNVMGFTPWLEREKYVKKIGVVFGQKSQLWWDLPPIDAYTLNKKMYDIPEDVFNENLTYFKEIFNIEEVVKRPTRNLSLGERMKCELVCALLHNPKIVFLDEPTIGVDLLSKEAIRNFIKEVNKTKNTTFILTTHDIDDIENLCNNVTIINDGTIVFNDTIDSLKTFFSDKKVVEVKFSKEVKEEDLSQFTVLKFEPPFASIELDLAKSDIKTEIISIFNTLPIHDIDVNSQDIEEVIKQIYRKEVTEVH